MMRSSTSWLVLLVTLISILQLATCIRSYHYKSTDVCLLSVNLLIKYQVFTDIESVSDCASICSEKYDVCASLEYDGLRRTCALYELPMTCPASASFSDKMMSLKPVDGWTVLLSVKAGSGVNVKDLWHSLTPVRNSEVVYQGGIIDELWGSLAKIRVSMESGGVRVFTVTFSAAGSHRASWFSPPNIIPSDTTYTDVLPSSTYSHFSIKGYKNANIVRRFYMLKSAGGCLRDSGWFFVADTDHPMKACEEFETNIPGPLPHFIYCPGTTHCLFANSTEVADTFIIEAVYQ